MAYRRLWGLAFTGSLALAGAVSATGSASALPIVSGAGTPATGTFVIGQAAPGVRVSRPEGPPSSPITVGGSGFRPHTAVDVYFDTTDEALVSTDATGGFSHVPLAVPAAALPGPHWVTAVGRADSRSAQVRYTVTTQWPTFRFSAAHTGVNPVENLLSPQTVPHLALDWLTPTYEVPTSPAVAGGVVYAGDEGDRVYAMRAATGVLLWTQSFSPDNLLYSSPTVSGGTVFIGSNDDVLHALDAGTGRKKWSFDVGEVGFSSPVVVHGIVYTGSYEGGTGQHSIYAINATTGKLVWQYQVGAEGIGLSSPTVADGTLFVGSEDHSVYALDAATGQLRWTFATGSIVESTVAVANGIAYVGSFDNTLYALNAATGELLWSATTGSSILASPAVADGVVYINSWDGYLYAYDAYTGDLLWRRYVFAGGMSSPTVANGVVYLNASSAIDAFTVAGALLWEYQTGSEGVYSSITVVDGALYTGDGNGVARLDLGPQQPAGAGRVSPAALVPDLRLRVRK